MPVYNWLCDPCALEDEAYVPAILGERPCPKCGEAMERTWRLGTKHIPGAAFPFMTRNLTGKWEEITSESHLQQRCKEEGVTHRPDVAYIEQEFKGVDFRTGKHQYKEASGVGLPGCWVSVVGWLLWISNTI